MPKRGDVIKDYVRDVSVNYPYIAVPVEYVYAEDPSIAFVLVHKDALPYMSGFETMTEFWNARSLTNNNDLIFGHNELEFLEEYPRIRVKVVLEETPSHTAPVRDVNLARIDGYQVQTSEEGMIDVNVQQFNGDGVTLSPQGLLSVNIAEVADYAVSTGNDGVMSVNIAEVNGSGSETLNVDVKKVGGLTVVDGIVPVDMESVGGTAVDVPTGTATEVKITK